MEIKIETGYALRMLLYLSEEDMTVSHDEIKDKLLVPPKYAGYVSTKLRVNGFVSSVSGRGGGFKLSRSPNEIKVYDVIKLMENKIRLNPFSDKVDFYKDDHPAITVNNFLSYLEQSFDDMLAAETLATLKARLSDEITL